MDSDPISSAPVVFERAKSCLLQSPPLFYENVRNDKNSKVGENDVKVDGATVKSEDATSHINNSESVKYSSSWVSIVGSDYLSDEEIVDNLESGDKELESDGISCFGFETLFDDASRSSEEKFETPNLSEVSASKVSSKNTHEEKNHRMNCCQKLCSWWKRSKSASCRIVVCCVPCVKRKKEKSQQQK